MKKTFEQPTFEVVRVSNNDVIVTSLMRGDNVNSGTNDAPDRFRDFEDYSY